jgi:hypothetical protein
MYRKSKELLYYDSRYKTVRVQDVINMKKRKNIKLPNIQAADGVKLGWEANRQDQQEPLEKKFMQWPMRPHEGQAYIERYPTTMQQMISPFHAKDR